MLLRSTYKESSWHSPTLASPALFRVTHVPSSQPSNDLKTSPTASHQASLQIRRRPRLAQALAAARPPPRARRCQRCACRRVPRLPSCGPRAWAPRPARAPRARKSAVRAPRATARRPGDGAKVRGGGEIGVREVRGSRNGSSGHRSSPPPVPQIKGDHGSSVADQRRSPWWRRG